MQQSLPHGSLIRPPNCSPTRQPSSGQREIIRRGDGCPTTASSGGRCSRKDPNWSVTDPRLYNEAFTGRAKSIPRCVFCLQEDHVGRYCPKNPNKAYLNWYPDQQTWQPPASHPIPPMQPMQPVQTPRQGLPQELCRRFNENKCRFPRCRYQHACKGCGAPHPWTACPRNNSRASGRAMAQPY